MEKNPLTPAHKTLDLSKKSDLFRLMIINCKENINNIF